MYSSNNKVNQFLIDISSTFPDQFEIVEEIRAAFFKENSQLEEDIKYGGIVFNLSGQLIGGLFLYKKHLSVEFSNGAQFLDPEGLLEGKGKLRRHLKMLESSDVESKNISFYIQQAVKS